MSLHPEAAAFLAAIADAPAEDMPRLAFADWLEEHGELDRAEFVRVQCELAAWPGCELKAKPGDVDCNQWNYLLGEGRVMTWCKPCVRRNELCRRELELWESKRGDEWVIRGVKPDAPDWIVHEAVLQNHIASSSTANVIVWSRGFPARIRCSWADCAAHLDTILADPWVPGLDEVELTTWPEFETVHHRHRNALRCSLPDRGTQADIGEQEILSRFPDLPRGERREAFQSEIVLRLLAAQWPKEKVRSWRLLPEPSLIDNLSVYWGMDEGT